MADVSLAGFSVPSQPNSGLAVYDVDVPQQYLFNQTAVEVDGSATVTERQGERGDIFRRSPADLAAVPANVVSAVVSPGLVTLTLDVPLVLGPGTITHGGSTVDVTSLAVSGFSLLQSVKGIIRRISKLNKGAN